MTLKFAYSGDVYKPSAGTKTFALTSSDGKEIKYLEKSHIHVYKSTDSGETYTELARPAKWDFSTDGKSVELVDGTADGDWIKVQRITPYEERYTTFQPSSNLTSDQLNDGEDFSLYVDQELSDGVKDIIDNGLNEDAPDEKAYVRSKGEWKEGVTVNSQDGKYYGRKDSEWVEIADGGGIDDVADDKAYVRTKGAWKAGVFDANSDNQTYARKDGGWVKIADGGGLVYMGTRDFTKAAPSSPSAGHLYINTATSGKADDSWTGIGGTTLSGSERASYSGTSWQILPMPTTPDASTEVKGVIEIATQAEADAGTDEERAITPKTMKAYVSGNAPAPPNASEDARGIIELATQDETNAGTDDERAVTPKKLKAVLTDKTGYVPLDLSKLTALP